MKNKPSVELVTEFVKKYHKRVGLRKLYKDFSITSADERIKYGKLWDAFAERIPDAYDKKTKENDNAVNERETAPLNGDGGTQPVETIQAEPESPENGQTKTA